MLVLFTSTFWVKNKFTFVEECKEPKSVTILLKGPTKFGITQMRDAIRDGIRALFHTLEEGCVVPGAGAFELAVSKKLESLKVPSKSVIGIKVFGESILVIPKVLVANAGHDAQAMILKAKNEQGDLVVGLDLDSGGTLAPSVLGIYDTYASKKQMIDASVVVATNLLLTDEIMRAGRSSLKTQ